MKDERIEMLIQLSETYGIDYNKDEAEEILEMVDKVNAQVWRSTKPLTPEEIEKRLRATNNENSEL